MRLLHLYAIAVIVAIGTALGAQVRAADDPNRLSAAEAPTGHHVRALYSTQPVIHLDVGAGCASREPGWNPEWIEHISNDEVYWDVGCVPHACYHWRWGATEYVARSRDTRAVGRLLELLDDPMRFAAAHSALVEIVLAADAKRAYDAVAALPDHCRFGDGFMSWYGLPLFYSDLVEKPPSLQAVCDKYGLLENSWKRPRYDADELRDLRQRWINYISASRSILDRPSPAWPSVRRAHLVSMLHATDRDFHGNYRIRWARRDLEDGPDVEPRNAGASIGRRLFSLGGKSADGTVCPSLNH